MLKKTICTETCNQGIRLDIFLSDELSDFSRSKIQTALKNMQITVNGRKEKASYLLKSDDIIDINIEDSDEIVINPENIPLDIKYEDEYMLVVNKPKNMLTHPTSKETSNTLVNALINKYGYMGLSSLNGNLRPGIVHRLDRNTSGLLMVAKTNDAHNFISEQIKNKTAVRKYLAIVSGSFDSDEGTINAPLARHATKCEKFTVAENGKPSITHYRVIERFKNYTFLELQLDTGRTHQIRVHMAYIGHPIINDSLYGGEKIKVKTTEQVLQAYKLSFYPYKADKKVDIEICADNDIQRVLNKLRAEK